MTPNPAPAPAPSKANVWAGNAGAKPQKSLREIQNEQAVEEAKRAKERAKEQARIASEAEAQRRKGVWGAQKQKTKSIAEIQMEEEMMRKMQAEAAGSRKKVSPQKSSWAGLAASGTPAAWNAGAGAGPKTDRRSDWPAVGSTSTNNWPAVGKTSAPVASTNQWPNLSGGSAKTKPARNPASNAGNSNMGSKWPSVSAVPSQQKQPRKQQQPAKRKTNSVWGNKTAPAKSLSDIQREQQSQQHQHEWPQPQQTNSGELAHNLKNMLGIGGGRSNVSGSRAWGNTSAGPAQPKSLREIQAEEARQKTQNSGRPNHAGGWAAKVSGSKATARTTNS